MKRLIPLLVAVVFSVTMFCSPVSAICPDPNNPGPRVTGSNTPSGDESGWHDPTSPGGEPGIIDEVLSYFKMYASNHFVVYIVAKKTENQMEKDDLTSHMDFGGSRGAPSE
jgi:hypothetical protein